MKSNKLSFFRKLIFSLVDYRIFPLIVKEKLISAIGYFVKLILLFSVIVSVMLTADLFKSVPKYIDIFERKMPNFTISSGKYSSDEEAEFELNQNVYVYCESNGAVPKTIDQIYNDTNKKYSTYMVVKSENVDVYTKNELNTLAKFGELVYSPVSTANKSSFVIEIRKYQDTFAAKLVVFLCILAIVFIIYLIYRLWVLLLYSFSVLFLNLIFMNKFRRRDYLKIAIYVSSLPILLETVAFAITKHLPSSANFITMLIALIYTYSALKAIKLDSILLTAIGDTPEEKIKNAINQAQEELKKELQELEEREQEEKRKNEEENMPENGENALKSGDDESQNDDKK